MMKKSAVVVSIVMLAVLMLSGSGVVQAQGPTEEWVATYNGPAEGHDFAKDITVDGSGNVYVTGSSPGSESQYDYATIKYDSAGVEQWLRRYNGPGNGDDNAYALAVDSSGNVYVTGYSRGSDSGEDYATIKYDNAGVEQWVRRYNGPGKGNDYANAIAMDNSGNVYVTGYSLDSDSDFDYATIKYDSAGAEQWVRRYNGRGNGSDKAYAIAVDKSGNVYVTGHSTGLSMLYDYATVKYGTNGDQLWVAGYNGPYNDHDMARAIAVDNSGNVYVTGGSSGSNILDDYATVKYDESGNQLWVARYNGPGLYTGDVAEDIAVDGWGNVYVTGSDGVLDYATIKYDGTGVEQWVRRYNGPGNDIDTAHALAIDGLGNVYVTGMSDSGPGPHNDYATIKYDSAGVEQWVIRYNGLDNGDDAANAIFVDSSGNVYVTGLGSGDYATIKYSELAQAQKPAPAWRIEVIIAMSLLIITTIVVLVLILRRRPA